VGPSGAEDLAQETLIRFLRAMRRERRAPVPEAAGAYIVTIATNLVKSRAAHDRWTHCSVDLAVECPVADDQELEPGQRSECRPHEFAEALDETCRLHFDSTTRAIIGLRRLGLAWAEIAPLAGLNLDATKQRFHRAIRMLRPHMASYLGDESPAVVAGLSCDDYRRDAARATAHE
jgi:DNA-directed RNA polymerase specialized sigma24 family protein